MQRRNVLGSAAFGFNFFEYHDQFVELGLEASAYSTCRFTVYCATHSLLPVRPTPWLAVGVFCVMAGGGGGG